MMVSKELDNVDKSILYLLQNNARRNTTEEMGEKVGVSSSTIDNRISRLEEDGVILGYHPVIKYGYSDLTVRDIDDEWEKSRQLINYYFDGKDELLTTVLVDLIGTAEEVLDPPSNDDPLSELNDVLNAILLEPSNEDIRYWEFLTAIYEMQAQAHRQPEYQEIFNQITDDSIEHLSEIISEGIEEGIFRSVDPVEIASMIDTIVTGAHIKKVYLGRDDAPKRARKTIDEFIVTQLLGEKNGLFFTE